MRRYDHDGRLHIELTPISKANICPYYGREIPDSERLRLDPTRIYHLLRDPEELRKAAETSNNIQLMYVHDPVTASDPKQAKVVGSTGTDARFDMPYLKNSLAVWTQDAIDLIESGRQKQLSCAYHYKADMTPGYYMGHPYDGVMRDIRFNHVALVADGRAGADVMVVDAMPEGLAYDAMPVELQLNSGVWLMPNVAVSHRALLAQGALMAFLGPRLANDAKIDYKKILLGTTSRNWDSAKHTIVARVTAATKGKLAQDASIEDVVKVLDSLDKIAMDEEVDEEAMDEEEESEEEKEARMAKEAKDKKAKDARAKAAKDKKAKDESKEEEDEAEKGEDAWPEKDDEEEKDKKEAKDNFETKPIAKKAMDAAIAAAVKATEKRVTARLHEIRAAEELVRPILGPILAQDSAAAVYKLLFDHAEVDVADVPEEGYGPLARSLIKTMNVKAGGNQQTVKRLASDAAASADFAKRFPDAARVRQV